MPIPAPRVLISQIRASISAYVAAVRKLLLYRTLIVWRTRAIWIRAALCLAIGAAVLVNDEIGNYDFRLQVRGPRPARSSVVLIDVSERDWNAMRLHATNVWQPLKEVASPTDAYFWNANVWLHLLANTLEAGPSAVAVVFYFGDNIGAASVARDSQAFSVFNDPRVIWGADVDSSGRVLLPVFASIYNNNVGLRGLHADDDGITRHFNSVEVQVPQLAVRAARVASHEQITRSFEQPTLINFAGNAESFKTFSFADILRREISSAELARDLHGKLVLIGDLSSPLERLQTPLGRMSRTEALANVADSILQNRVITRGSTATYFVLLVLLLIGSVAILLIYPQSVAFLFFLVLAVMWAAASVWIFDSQHFWLPAFSPLVQLIVTYIVFMSYRLSLNEQRTWRLQQEQKYNSEIEQLKTNFVSMMSHDLKTPIAKIQAICDRLIANVSSSPSATGSFDASHWVDDLRSLRGSSDDLHRYIQRILQVTKVEAKDFKISKEVTDINENIEKVIARLQPLAREKQIRIATDLEPMFSIEADTTLLQEIIQNLIENAIKYTPNGGRITVISREKDDFVRVIVKDTGPGIAREEQPHIWGKFIRGRKQELTTKGTGLGLYLVKYFVELHGGQVFLNSQTAADVSVSDSTSDSTPYAEAGGNLRVQSDAKRASGALDDRASAQIETGTEIGFTIPIALDTQESRDDSTSST